jgi:hypothetical protein
MRFVAELMDFEGLTPIPCHGLNPATMLHPQIRRSAGRGTARPRMKLF